MHVGVCGSMSMFACPCLHHFCVRVRAITMLKYLIVFCNSYDGNSSNK